MLRVSCPSCGTGLKVRPEQAGKRIACPRCKQSFALALPRDDAASAEPASQGGGGGLVVVLLLLLLLGGGAGAGWLVWTGRLTLPTAAPDAKAVAQATEPTKAAPADETPKPVEDTRSPAPAPAVPPAAVPGTRSPVGSAPEPKADPTAKAGGQRYALLVGVQQYDSKELLDLKYTENDIKELANVLLAAGYPKENVVVLTSERGKSDANALPTADRIRAELDRLLKSRQPDDLVLLAFAGHGIERQTDRKFYFCPLGANLKEPKTLVALNEVYDGLKGCGAGYKLLLADACRNDPTPGRSVSIPEEANVPSVTRPQYAAPPGGVIAFYSCSANQFAFEPEELKHGVFFHYLIEGLKGAADFDDDGDVIREEVEAYVKKRVRAYTAEKFKREQWPHLLGESNDQRPLVKLPPRPTPAPGATAKPKVARRDLTSPLLLEENFKAAPRGKTPQGWNGRDLWAVYEKDGVPHLRPTARKGVLPPLTLPDTPLVGDFYVECEFRLGSSYDSHQLQLRLEGLGVGLPLTITAAGTVALSDRPPQTPEGFNSDKINRLRLVREGRNYRVSVNDSVVVDSPLPYVGNFDRLHLALTAGKHWGEDAKLFAVRIGKLAALGDGREPPPPPRTGKVLLEEEFTRTPSGNVPSGWDGRDVVLVQRGEADRAGLEANEDKDFHYVTLPPVALTGDFFVECQFHLGSSYDSHELVLRLEGKGGTLPLKVASTAAVTLHDRPPRTVEGFNPDVVNRLRILREGRRYIVSVNDVEVPGLAFPLPGFSDFNRVQIGLSAGKHWGGRMKIHGVRLGVLDSGAAPASAGATGDAKPATAKSINEDFRKAPLGDVPEGWKVAHPTLGVQKTGGRYSLEVTDPSKGGGLVALPGVSLPRDFVVEWEFDLPGKDTSVFVQLEGPPSAALVLAVDGGGKVGLQGRVVDAAKALAAAGKANRIRLERAGDTYTVQLNDTKIGQMKVADAPGQFEVAKLGLVLQTTKSASPKVYSVRVEPAAKE